MKNEKWKMKNEKLLEICSALGLRKRRKATEARSTTARTAITYNSLNFGQINIISRLLESAWIGLKFAYTKLSHTGYKQEVIW